VSNSCHPAAQCRAALSLSDSLKLSVHPQRLEGKSKDAEAQHKNCFRCNIMRSLKRWRSTGAGAVKFALLKSEHRCFVRWGVEINCRDRVVMLYSDNEVQQQNSAVCAQIRVPFGLLLRSAGWIADFLAPRPKAYRNSGTTRFRFYGMKEWNHRNRV
jgi:hypothetical protein